ncbi:hypothetical protein CANINC_000812 [Pichia inconspicua]|uniref:Peroxisome assembly protein 12 n=1 Tax=Pichia inconspicua TaxID=52247 RepID=A0A4T0X5A9_9ASCO|nr:hypothetical protein CANINC_000812 [[Candida] inconspicua]
MDFYSSLNSNQLDLKKPTIFELALCSQIDNLLTPSVRFLLAHYTHRYPRLLIRILNNFDELNLIVRSFIEYQYLKSWNSTFIEKFYGIKRTNKLLTNDLDDTTKTTNLKRLKPFQIFISLIDSVGISYIDNKLQLYHDKLVPEFLINSNVTDISEKPENQNISFKVLCFINQVKKLIKTLFFKYYPTAKLIMKLMTLMLNILYIADKTSSTTIIQWLSNIAYERITSIDHHRIDSGSSSETIQLESLNVPPTLTSVIVSNLKSMVTPIRKIAWTTTDTILPISIFTLKFLEWYNSQNNLLKNDDNSHQDIPIVPSIVPLDILQDEEERAKYITSTSDESVCRICNDTIHNPAVIETGYVFCYKCIYEYLRDQQKDKGGRCPVSGRKLFGCSWNELTEEWDVKEIRKLII